MAGQKSFRRKYNKIRHTFKDVFVTNIELHEEEEKLIRISQRLRLQNDQLLDTLLDINESKRIPRHLRYALTTPPPESEVPGLQVDTDVSKVQAKQILEEARQQLESGDLMQRDYDILVEELRSSLKKNTQVMPLPQMEQTISHTSLALLKEAQIPDDIKDEEFSTYLDATHEDTYLSQIDAAINGTQQSLNPETQQPQQPQQPPKPILSEATYKNPVSTYNWLRQHKPEIFTPEGGSADKDKDKDKDKPDDKETKPNPSTSATGGAAANKRESGRAIKRASAVELLDDEGNVVGNYAETTALPAGKSKRKRDDDAYRPKGGGSGGGGGGGGTSSSKRRKKSTVQSTPAE